MATKIEVDITQAEAAIAIFEKLAVAANMAREAIEKLNGAGHGGISVQIAGPLAVLKVKPVARATAIDQSVVSEVKRNLPHWIEQIKVDGLVS